MGREWFQDAAVHSGRPTQTLRRHILHLRPQQHKLGAATVAILRVDKQAPKRLHKHRGGQQGRPSGSPGQENKIIQDRIKQRGLLPGHQVV